MTVWASSRAMHLSKGCVNPCRNKYPSIIRYCLEFLLTSLASLRSWGNSPCAKYRTYDIMQVSSFLPSKTSIFGASFISVSTKTLGVLRVSCITDRLSPFAELGNFENKLARVFCPLGICVNSNESKFIYERIQGLFFQLSSQGEAVIGVITLCLMKITPQHEVMTKHLLVGTRNLSLAATFGYFKMSFFDAVKLKQGASAFSTNWVAFRLGLEAAYDTWRFVRPSEILGGLYLLSACLDKVGVLQVDAALQLYFASWSLPHSYVWWPLSVLSPSF